MDFLGDDPGDNSWKYCKLCNIRFTSRKLSESHAQSALHKKNETKLADASKRLAQKNAAKGLTSQPGHMTGYGGQSEAQYGGNRVQTTGLLSASPHGTNIGQHALQPDCKACKVGGFRAQSQWNDHVESTEHCKTILRLFYSLDHLDFFRLYGDVPYSKNKDVSSNSKFSVDIEQHMAIRSGILNDFDCAICRVQMGRSSLWMNHIRSKKHIMTCIEYVERLGREEHIKRFGDIPFPREKEYKTHLFSYRRKEAQQARQRERQEQEERHMVNIKEVFATVNGARSR